MNPHMNPALQPSHVVASLTARRLVRTWNSTPRVEQPRPWQGAENPPVEWQAQGSGMFTTELTHSQGSVDGL